MFGANLRRIVRVVKRLPGVLAVAAVALAASACAGGDHESGTQGGATVSVVSRIVARTVSSSRLILGGRVRCIATVTSPVAAGQEIAAIFSYRSVSSHPVAFPGGSSLVLRSPDGTSYDTARLITTEPTVWNKIRPGVTKTERMLPAPVVRWSGPLRVTPKCDAKPLPTLRVPVTAPGPPPSGRAAVADVVAASGFLFRRCRPRAPGVAVRGELVAPDGRAPAMVAKCSITIRRERGFDDAQALVVTPPGQRVRLWRPYEQLRVPLHTRPFEAIAWEFVVTRDGASPVAAETGLTDATDHRMAPSWTWTGSRWKSGSPDPCVGGEAGLGGLGALAADPTVVFISACRP